MEDSHLLPQPVFALAQRADPAPDRGDMLPEGEVDAFHERGIDLLAMRSQHGNVADALTKLAELRDKVSDEGHRSKLTGLYDYLHRNQTYLVNYDARDQANKTYTSQVAESHMETLINARHKRTKKRQWTREGAHHVLQIRAMMASDEWESRGQGAILLALEAAA